MQRKRRRQDGQWSEARVEALLKVKVATLAGSKIRNPKSEGRKKTEIRNPKTWSSKRRSGRVAFDFA